MTQRLEENETLHEHVRKNPEEARKLNRIDRELRKNPKLTEVDTGAAAFEQETDMLFNEQMEKDGVALTS